MDILTKNKVLTWTIGILILLNLTCLSLLWFGNPQRLDHQPPPPRDPETAARFLKDQLNFSDEQFNKYLLLRDSHLLNTQSVQREMEILRHNLMEELFKDNPNQEIVSEIETRIGENQTSLERLTFDHFMGIKNLCAPDQNDRLRLLFQGIARNIQAPSPQDQPGRPAAQGHPGGPAPLRQPGGPPR